MRINLLTSFAAGVFITTSICSAVYFTTKSDDSKPAVSVNDMKSKLTAEGYVVQTKAEYDKSTKNAKSSDKKPKKDSTTTDSNSQQPVIRTTVTVSDGMTSYDVGKMLLAAKIITNQPFAFSKDIEARGLQNNLKPGAYEVDSSMTYDQVISTIFKK